jgi:hypothetical protein
MAEQKVRRRNAHINNTIKKIIDKLREFGRPMTLNELEASLGDNISASEEILTHIKQDNNKIHYDEHYERFSLKTTYPSITDKQSFNSYFSKAS